MIGSRYSFKFLSRAKIATIYPDLSPKTEKAHTKAEIDDKKRSFLKLAGVVGVGALATTILPKKASALVFGSTPTATSLGVKNASGTKINPATQETLAEIKASTDLLSFDAGSQPANLKVKIADGSVGVQNASAVVINPATEDTLALIKAQTNKLTFDGSNNLLTSVGGSGNIVGLKDVSGATINPATDESLVYLRRMVKLMESQATVDASNRQRVVVDGFGATVTGVGASGAGVPRVTVASDSAFSATITSLNGWGDAMFQDVARNTYANGIRTNISFV